MRAFLVRRCGCVEAAWACCLDKKLASAPQPWTWYADKAGVADTVAFTQCLSDSGIAAVVNEDVEAADGLHVSATPTWLLNEEKYVGDVWDLERLIERHLQRPVNVE